MELVVSLQGSAFRQGCEVALGAVLGLLRRELLSRSCLGIKRPFQLDLRSVPSLGRAFRLSPSKDVTHEGRREVDFCAHNSRAGVMPKSRVASDHLGSGETFLLECL